MSYNVDMPSRDEEMYVKGTFRPALCADGKVRQCFVPPLIAGKKLALPPSILAHSDAAEDALWELEHSVYESALGRRTHPRITRETIARHIAPSEAHRSDTLEKRGTAEEADNYLAALSFLSSEPSHRRLTFDSVCAAHTLLVNSSRGNQYECGVLRNDLCALKDIDTLEVVYIPPRPQDVPALVEDLEQFWNEDDSAMSAAVRIAIAQYQFAAIHPFDEGNGRTSRLLSDLLLWKYGLIGAPYISLQGYFEAHRQQYHLQLRKVHDTYALFEWIHFFLDGVEEQAMMYTKEPKPTLDIS